MEMAKFSKRPAKKELCYVWKIETLFEEVMTYLSHMTD